MSQFMRMDTRNATTLEIKEGQHMELKTLHGWHEFAEKNSDGSWDKYCKPGDLVDEARGIRPG